MISPSLTENQLEYKKQKVNTMITNFENRGFEFEVLDGEYRRYRNRPGEPEHAEYLCVAKYNGNRILLHHVREDGEIVNFVQTIYDKLPDFAFNYLMNVLNEHQNVVARALYVAVPDSITGYEIYYDCDCNSDKVDDIIEWIATHNDFDAADYRYTEVVNGHQKCVGT